MFEIIAGWISDGWDALKLCEIIPEYDGGVHLRFGKYFRDLEPGLQWKIPFVDEFITVNCKSTTVGTSCQSLETADNVQVVVEAVVRYRVERPRNYLLDCNDPDSILNDTVIGVIGECIVESKWEDFRAREWDLDTLKKIRNRVRKFGFRVEELQFATRAPIQSFRLIFDQPEGE